MSLDEIRKRIQKIQDTAPDYEVQHVYEDELLIDFIRYVAVTDDSLLMIQRKADAVLKVKDIDFLRECA